MDIELEIKSLSEQIKGLESNRQQDIQAIHGTVDSMQKVKQADIIAAQNRFIKQKAIADKSTALHAKKNKLLKAIEDKHKKITNEDVKALIVVFLKDICSLDKLQNDKIEPFISDICDKFNAEIQTTYKDGLRTEEISIITKCMQYLNIYLKLSNLHNDNT